MEIKESLKLISDEINLVESRNLDYFKSKQSLTDENDYLRLKDCIGVFKYYPVPPEEQRLPPPGDINYIIGFIEDSLTKEIENELRFEINKKFK